MPYTFKFRVRTDWLGSVGTFGPRIKGGDGTRANRCGVIAAEDFGGRDVRCAIRGG